MAYAHAENVLRARTVSAVATHILLRELPPSSDVMARLVSVLNVSDDHSQQSSEHDNVTGVLQFLCFVSYMYPSMNHTDDSTVRECALFRTMLMCELGIRTLKLPLWMLHVGSRFCCKLMGESDLVTLECESCVDTYLSRDQEESRQEDLRNNTEFVNKICATELLAHRVIPVCFPPCRRAYHMLRLNPSVYKAITSALPSDSTHTHSGLCLSCAALVYVCTSDQITYSTDELLKCFHSHTDPTAGM